MASLRTHLNYGYLTGPWGSAKTEQELWARCASYGIIALEPFLPSSFSSFYFHFPHLRFIQGGGGVVTRF